MIFIHQHTKRAFEKVEIIAIGKCFLADFAVHLLSGIFLDLLQLFVILFLLRHL